MKQTYFSICLILLASTLNVAQTDDSGVKKTSAAKRNQNKITPKKTPQPITPKNFPTPTVKKPETRSPKANKPPTPKIQFAGLSVTVSEPESEIFIFTQKGSALADSKPHFTDEYGVLQYNKFPVGTYTLTVRKDGFLTERRTIDVKAGVINEFSITLRPEFISFSVSTVPRDARIEIENIGEFDNQINNLRLKPGTYRLHIFKDGFERETQEVTLGSGEPQNLTVILRRISPEKLFPQAQAAFDAQNYDKSAELARKILDGDSGNAKANLLLGKSLFNLPGSGDAFTYLARAVSGGETVSLPVRLYNKEKGDLQLLPGNLIIKRNTVEYQGTHGVNSGFIVMRGKNDRVSRKTDNFGLWYFELNVEGNFNGRRDRRAVRIYSDDVVVVATRDQLVCSSCRTGECLCQSKNHNIFQLLENWRRGL